MGRKANPFCNLHGQKTNVNTNPFKETWRCRECANTKQNEKNKELKSLVFIKLGGECNCCGDIHSLQIDHIKPVSNAKRNNRTTVLRHVLAQPQLFQLLCKDCNRWKDNGPCCPCKYWTKFDPEWRVML